MSPVSATAEAPAMGPGAVSGPVSAIARRYADALFDLACDGKALEAVEADLASLGKAVRTHADLRQMLMSPVHNSDDQTRAIGAIAEKAGFNALTRKFIALVAKNRRLFALEAMAAAFAARMAVHRGEVTAEAVSAAPLNDDQMRRLRGEIERHAGKAVNLATRVDPELLGGLIVKIGSKMIDSSLKTKLSRLKSVMKEA
ncbi:MAG: F0F1 ATP synthase subunit delta [Parvularculaceae bacterium]